MFNLQSKNKSGGLEISYAIPFKMKWRVNVGLGYKQRGESFIATNADFASQQGAFDPNPIANEQVLIRGNVKTQFISLPITIDRKIAARWSLEGGFRYNQKIGDFDSRFFKKVQRSTFDFFLTPRYQLSQRWAIGLTGQYSTNHFESVKDLGKFQLGFSTRFWL